MLGLKAGIKREISRMTSRKIYFFGMILVPVFVAVFFLSLLSPVLPLKVPTAIVDLDHSTMSRSITRSLNATELIDITGHCESYDDALRRIRKGEIFGFFVIPADFESDALGGRKPTLSYYTNLTYFVPGTLSYKGFKTIAVSTAASVVSATMSSMGIPPEQAGVLIQPVTIDNHPLGNPWLSYAIYLCPSFTMATLALMVMLMTVFSITMEIKQGTSPQWLDTSGGSILVALTSKLIPQTVVFTSVTWFIEWLLFGYSHFPMHTSAGWMLLAGFLLVAACQSFAVFVCCVVPNPRLAFSLCALFGILSFSFTGFSFPVQSMYGALAIFSYLAPIRYFILIYFNQALNGYDVYYSRFYFAALLLFPLVAMTLLYRLKKACRTPVYVP